MTTTVCDHMVPINADCDECERRIAMPGTVECDGEIYDSGNVRHMLSRIAELDATVTGLQTFIAKQAASGRALQRRLARAGLDANMPGDAEREELKSTT